MHTIFPGRMGARFSLLNGAEARWATVVESTIIPLSSSKTLVRHCVEVPQLPGNCGPRQHQSFGRWQRSHQLGAVTLGDNAIIRNDDSAAIGRGPNQSSKTLLQPQSRVRNHVLGERIAAPVEDCLAIRGGDRLCRNAKWKPRNEQPSKRVPWNVYALPI